MYLKELLATLIYAIITALHSDVNTFMKKYFALPVSVYLCRSAPKAWLARCIKKQRHRAMPAAANTTAAHNLSAFHIQKNA